MGLVGRWRFEFPREKGNWVGKYCLATGHQRQLTNQCTEKIIQTKYIFIYHTIDSIPGGGSLLII
jgi:hypothetical protein